MRHPLPPTPHPRLKQLDKIDMADSLAGPPMPKNQLRQLVYIVQQSPMFTAALLAVILASAVFEALQSPVRDTEEWRQARASPDSYSRLIVTPAGHRGMEAGACLA